MTQNETSLVTAEHRGWNFPSVDFSGQTDTKQNAGPLGHRRSIKVSRVELQIRNDQSATSIQSVVTTFTRQPKLKPTTVISQILFASTPF